MANNDWMKTFDIESHMLFDSHGNAHPFEWRFNLASSSQNIRDLHAQMMRAAQRRLGQGPLPQDCHDRLEAECGFLRRHPLYPNVGKWTLVRFNEARRMVGKRALSEANARIEVGNVLMSDAPSAGGSVDEPFIVDSDDDDEIDSKQGIRRVHDDNGDEPGNVRNNKRQRTDQSGETEMASSSVPSPNQSIPISSPAHQLGSDVATPDQSDDAAGSSFGTARTSAVYSQQPSSPLARFSTTVSNGRESAGHDEHDDHEESESETSVQEFSTVG
ncbi:hypothetical protein PT974_10002 [Cladobotryum mycophilum]|uniref:HNH nuclease domain-containing protein n=1 Tax=Cladobotryum mycophilum TaxID=491253 RepID=A0ABR0S962_9HYPO